MRDKTKISRGSMLLESILAMALLALFFTIFLGSVTYLNESTLRAKTHTQALFLAQEGQEGVRAIRNTDHLRIVEGVHGLSSINNRFELDGSSDDEGGCTRTVSIGVENDGGNIIEVSVSCEEGGRQTTVALETYLSRGDTQ